MSHRTRRPYLQIKMSALLQPEIIGMKLWARRERGLARVRENIPLKLVGKVPSTRTMAKASHVKGGA
jgi:hypothetical protein